MKQLKEYQKPFLRDYSYFGVVVEGETTPGGQGEARSDEDVCNVSGLDSSK